MNEEKEELEKLDIFMEYAKQYLKYDVNYDNLSSIVDSLYDKDNCVTTELAQDIENTMSKLENIRKDS